MRLKNLCRMSVIEILLAGQLLMATGILELALRVMLFHRLVSWVRWGAATWCAHFLPLGRRRVSWKRLISLTDSAVHFWRGKDGCLRRSLILLWLLVSRGHEAVLVIGVRRDSTEPFSGHAWIEVGNSPMAQDRRKLSRFAELSRH